MNYFPLDNPKKLEFIEIGKGKGRSFGNNNANSKFIKVKNTLDLLRNI
jgi:hypothetical protein